MQRRGTFPNGMRASAVGRVLLAGLLVVGCSSDRISTYPTEGQVVFPDGQPVRTGLLELRSLEHDLNARGQIARDGSFALGTYTVDDGAVAGKHQAIVMQFLATDSDPDIRHDHGDPVDRKFADYTTSPLQVEIQPTSLNQLNVIVNRQQSTR